MQKLIATLIWIASLIFAIGDARLLIEYHNPDPHLFYYVMIDVALLWSGIFHAIVQTILFLVYRYRKYKGSRIDLIMAAFLIGYLILRYVGPLIFG